MKLLVVVAHPDDESYSMGGTIYHFSRKHEFILHVLTSKNIGLDLGKHDAGNKNEALRNAAEILGIKEVYYGDHNALRLDSYPLINIIQQIEKTIEKEKPDFVFTHAPDISQDHRIVYNATALACRPKPGRGIKGLYRFEVPDSTIWDNANRFTPTNFVPLTTEDMEAKTEAIDQYWMENEESPHPRSVDNIHDLASYRGSAVGYDWAEAFQLDRKIGI